MHVLERLKALPLLVIIGLPVLVIGALLDVALNLAAEPQPGHHGMGFASVGAVFVLIGMVLVLAGVVTGGRGRYADNRGLALGRRPEPSRRAMDRVDWLRTALIAALLFAGVVHLLLAPEHFDESTVMGIGFVGSGVAEILLAAAVLMMPRRIVHVAVIFVAAGLIGMYAFNVMIGLPFSASANPDGVVAEEAGHPAADSAETGHGAADQDPAHAGSGHHSDGLVLGQGEPVDLLGFTTKLSELAAIGLALALLRRRTWHSAPAASRSS